MNTEIKVGQIWESPHIGYFEIIPLPSGYIPWMRMGQQSEYITPSGKVYYIARDDIEEGSDVVFYRPYPLQIDYVFVTTRIKFLAKFKFANDDQVQEGLELLAKIKESRK